MSLNSQKRIAAELMKCGVSRIRMQMDKEVEEALTRNDVRILIKKGMIYKVRKKGSSKAFSKLRLHQKEKGRRKGYGSRKGTKKARSPRKKQWIKSVRTLRNLLKEMRDSGQIEKGDYRELYLRVKGGSFRNKSHFIYYLKEKEYLKKPRARKKKEKSGVKEKKVTAVKKVVEKKKVEKIKEKGAKDEKKK